MFLNPVHVGSSFFIKSSDDTLCSNPFHPLPALVQIQVKMCRNVACEMYLRGKKIKVQLSGTGGGTQKAESTMLATMRLNILLTNTK